MGHPEQEALEGMNNGFGPISVRRGNKATYVGCMILLAFVAISGIWLYRSGEKYDLKCWYFELILLSLGVVGAILGELIRRCCLFFEEYSHINKRYLGKRKTAVLACFYQNNIQLVVVVGLLCFAFAMVLSRDEHAAFDSRHWEMFLVGMIFVPLVSYLIGLRTPTAAEKSQLNEAESNNVADGLAYIYYFGYLKLILPRLDETINETDVLIDGVHFRDKIAANKLFI